MSLGFCGAPIRPLSMIIRNCPAFIILNWFWLTFAEVVGQTLAGLSEDQLCISDFSVRF